jgi:hypothetical protein
MNQQPLAAHAGWMMSELETLFHQVPVPLNDWPE